LPMSAASRPLPVRLGRVAFMVNPLAMRPTRRDCAPGLGGCQRSAWATEVGWGGRARGLKSARGVSSYVDSSGLLLIGVRRRRPRF
jgi:hypothetical protein